MHIDSLSLYHVALPRKTPKIIAGRPCETLETVLVRLASGGAVGWGEAAPGNAPTGSSEWAAGAFAVLRDWLARRWSRRKSIRARPWRNVSRRFAATNTPRPRWISPGGTSRDECKAGRCMSCSPRALPSPPAPLPRRVRGEVEGRGWTVHRSNGVGRCVRGGDRSCLRGRLSAGQTQVPPGLGPGNAPRRAAGFPGEMFHIDCEGALSLNYTEMLYRFDDFALEMVEQPLAAEDFVAHAMLQESLRTPICLDESIASPLHAEMAIDLKSCRQVNLKAGRVGGLTAARRSSRPARPPRSVAGAGPRRRARLGPGPTWPWRPAPPPHTRPISFPPQAKWPRTWPSRCTRFAMRAMAWRESPVPPSRDWGSCPTPRCWRSSRCKRRRCKPSLVQAVACGPLDPLHWGQRRRE